MRCRAKFTKAVRFHQSDDADQPRRLIVHECQIVKSVSQTYSTARYNHQPTAGLVTDKSIAVSYRVSARFKRLLETAAARADRSQTNMLEHLLYEYCKREGIEVARAGAQEPQGEAAPT